MFIEYFSYYRMGRLNKKIQQKQKKQDGLSLKNKLKSIAKDENVAEMVDLKSKSKKKVVPDTTKIVTPSDSFLLLTKPEKPTKALGLSGNASKIRKKDRIKMKSDMLRKRLAAQEVMVKEEKAKKKRQQTAVVGDMKPMTETLAAIDKLISESEESGKKKPKKQGNKASLKKRQKTFMQNISVFKQVNKHPEYSKNPFKTISTHIENKMLLEAMQGDE